MESCSLSAYVTYRWLILTDLLSWPKLSIIFDRHVSDVSVSDWCRWPNDRKRFSELLYHWPGQYSCQRRYQDYVWYQQPDRSYLHKRCRPGPRGKMQLKVRMQIFADHHSMVHLTKMYSVLGGEKFPTKTTDCWYGGNGTNKWRCGNHTRIWYQQ